MNLDLGNKRFCGECGTFFFDMQRAKPKCPKCGAVCMFYKSRGGKTSKINDTIDDVLLSEERSSDGDVMEFVDVDNYDENTSIDII